MTNEGLIQGHIYATPWEILFAVTYLMTFTAISVAGINVSDKICFGIIAIVPLLKWTRLWFDVLFKDYILLVIWVALPLLNLLFTDYPVKSLMLTINYVMEIMVVTGFTIIYARYKMEPIKILEFSYHMATICAVIGILQYYFFTAVTKFISIFSEGLYLKTWNGMPRVGSLFDNPNLFAALSAYSFIFGIILWIYNRKKRYVIEEIIIAYGLACSGSRMPVIGVLVGVGIIFILSFQPRYKIPLRIRRVFLAFCFGAGILFIIIILCGHSRFRLMFQGIMSGDWDAITNGRTIIWGNLLSKMDGHWLLGLGNGASGYLALPAWDGAGPHSLYVGMLVEMGIPGLSLFLIFVTVTYVKAIKYLESPQERMCFCTLIPSMLVVQITEMSLDHVYQFIFWFWLIVSMPYCKKLKNKYRKNGGIQNEDYRSDTRKIPIKQVARQTT